MENQKKRGFPPYIAFLLFNAAFFMMDTTNSYFQIYLNDIGLTKTMIGTITGTASLVALVFQPVFGVLTDSAKSKSRVLQGMVLLSAILYPLILLNKNFIYILLVYTGYVIFRNFQHPLNTTLSVEYSEQSGRPYGPIRMMGAVGYALMMSLVGVVSAQENGVEKTFILYSGICLLNILLIFLLPPMKGHNRKSEGKKISPTVLFKSKPILTLILFQILVSVFSNLCRSYFGLYFTDDMGGSNQLYGTMLSVAAAIEIPFLAFSDYILKKQGPKRMLMILGLMTSARWILCFLAKDTVALFIAYCGNFISILEGITYALLLSRMVAPQLKTSVQTLSATIQNVASILISSYLGGILADWIGIRPLFLISGVLVALVTVIFCGFIFKFDQSEVKKHGEDLALSGNVLTNDNDKKKKTAVISVVAFVTSLLSLLAYWLAWWIRDWQLLSVCWTLGLLAIIMSIVAKKVRLAKKQKGDGYEVLSIVLGVISIFTVTLVFPQIRDIYIWGLVAVCGLIYKFVK